MNNEILSLIVPSALTIVGWFVAAFWAVRQVNKAHEKNRELQNEILSQSIKDSVYRDFIGIYKDIGVDIIKLTSALSHVSINMHLGKEINSNKICVGWENLLPEVDTAYSNLSSDFSLLEIWLAATSEHLPNTSNIRSIIENFQLKFTARNDTQIRDSSWILLQVAKTGLLVRGLDENKLEAFTTSVTAVTQDLNSILSELKQQAKEIQSFLIERKTGKEN